MLEFERKLWRRGITHIAGIDEAGRGPLAGPVVAAAVIFPSGICQLAKINDSKRLSHASRLEAKIIIEREAVAIGIGIVPPNVIDEINILQATFKAMELAIGDLAQMPDYLLIDGKWGPDVEIPCELLIKGDSRSMSIAAASIIAKLTRDEIMINEDKNYPQYGFAEHKGYPTPRHIEAIRQYGYCEIHRRSFHPKEFE